VEVTAARGSRFDTSKAPSVAFGHRCRFARANVLACSLDDGRANPLHVVRVSFTLLGRATGRPVVRFKSRLGVVVPWRADLGGAATRNEADLRVDIESPGAQLIDPRKRDQVVHFTIKVRNAGPARSPGGQVGFGTFGADKSRRVHAIRVQGASRCDARECELVALAVGEVAEIRLEVPVSVTTTLRGNAYVAGSIKDPVKLNNTATASADVVLGTADLSVDQSTMPKLSFIGLQTGTAAIPINVLFRNHGPGPVRLHEAVVRFTASFDVSFVGVDAGDFQLACAQETSRSFHCALPEFESGMMAFTARIVVVSTGSLAIRIEVSAPAGIDSNTRNNVWNILGEVRR
jgi:hypothetical protein